MPTVRTSSWIKPYAPSPHKVLHIDIRHYARPLLLGIGGIVGAFCVINSVIAFLQVNRMPLFLRVDGANFSLASAEDAKERLGKLSVPPLTLMVGTRIYTALPSDVGLRVDTDATLRAAMEEREWSIVPLLQAYHSARQPARVVYAVDERKMTVFLKERVAKESKAPADAAIVIPSESDKPAYIVPEQIGAQFDVQRAYAQVVSELRQHERLSIVIHPRSVAPKVSARQLESSLLATNRMLGTRLTLTGGGASYELTAQNIRSLVRLTPGEKGIVVPVIDRGAMVGLLQSINKTFYKAPTHTVITRIDGRSAHTSQGSAGHALNNEATADAIIQALQKGQTKQEVVLSSIVPSTTYRSDYSPTSEGLQALIRDFASTHRGTYYVVARELSGNRAAYYNHQTSVVPASIFKVFLAYVALHKIEQGQLQFSTQTSHGSIDHCIRQMITISTDSCAIAIMDHIGRAEVDAVIHAAGFGATSLNNPAGQHKSSSADDIANILTGLHSGSLLSRSNSDYLLNLMRQQVYRKGIPAGSAGAPVADKVGVLYSWTHDAGIVYAPHSTYVLVIMTANGGGGYDNIRELARGVYDIYNR